MVSSLYAEPSSSMVGLGVGVAAVMLTSCNPVAVIAYALLPGKRAVSPVPLIAYNEDRAAETAFDAVLIYREDPAANTGTEPIRSAPKNIAQTDR